MRFNQTSLISKFLLIKDRLHVASLHTKLVKVLKKSFVNKFIGEFEPEFYTFFLLQDISGAESILKCEQRSNEIPSIAPPYENKEGSLFVYDSLVYEILSCRQFKPACAATFSIRAIDFSADRSSIVNPFNLVQYGPRFSKYTHCIRYRAFFFTYYYFCTDKITRPNMSRLIDQVYCLTRNDTIFLNTYLRSVVIECEKSDDLAYFDNGQEVTEDNSRDENDDYEEGDDENDDDADSTISKSSHPKAVAVNEASAELFNSQCSRIRLRPRPLIRNFLGIMPIRRVEPSIELLNNILEICYDIETCVYKGVMVPYLICAKINVPSSILITHKKETINTVETFTLRPCDHDTFITVGYLNTHSFVTAQFVNWLLRIVDYLNYINMTQNQDESSKWINIRLFGFNNFSFDDNFIINELRSRHDVSFTYASRSNHVTHASFRVRRVQIIMNDLTKWVKSTLRKACQDFKVPTPKLDINIVAINSVFQELEYVPYYVDRSVMNIAYEVIDDESLEFRESFKYVSEEEDLFPEIILADTQPFYRLFDLIKSYCERDVQSTLEIYCILRTSVNTVLLSLYQDDGLHLKFLDFLSYISIPQLSFDIIKQLWLLGGTKVFCYKSEALYDFINQTYYGGKCLYSFVGELKLKPENVLNMDVTSLYPLVMTGLFPSVNRNLSTVKIGSEFPLGLIQQKIDEAARIVESRLESQTLHLDFTFLRFFNVTKFFCMCQLSPPSHLYQRLVFPPLPSRIEGLTTKRLEYSYNAHTAVRNSTQIKSAILCGYTIKVIQHPLNIFFSQTAPLLRSFVDIFSAKKQKASEDGNKTEKDIFKLILNSGYGKLGQRKENLLRTQRARNSTIIENNRYTEHSISASFPHFASLITAESQHLMTQYLLLIELPHIYMKSMLEERVGHVLYQDTDSLKINIFSSDLFQSTPYHIRVNFATFTINEKLGCWNDNTQIYDATWKNEYSEKFDSLIILSRKCYFFSFNEKVIIHKGKGISDMSKLDYTMLKQLASGVKGNLDREALKKQKQTFIVGRLTDGSSTNSCQDIVNSLSIGLVRKTLVRDEITPDCKLLCLQPEIRAMNLDNLNENPVYDPLTNQLLYRNYLQFVSGIRNLDTQTDYSSLTNSNGKRTANTSQPAKSTSSITITKTIRNNEGCSSDSEQSDSE